MSILDTPEEVDTFWKGCQEQLGLATNPQRFAVQTLKALLFQVECEHVVLSMERKSGWDTLLSADTHHYAVGLLAREMRHVSPMWCCSITDGLLELLSQGMSDWELPAMAFLVEFLQFPDFDEWGDSILEMMARQLQSESREMRRLALRGLMVLSRDPSMNKRMSGLCGSLVALLRDADEDVIEMTLVVLTFLLLHGGLAIPSPIALQLAGALWPLLDNDNRYLQLKSIRLFQEMLKLAKGEKALKVLVSKSLLPLFFHCHDENAHVAEASRETLLSAVSFLKRRDLEHLVSTDHMWSFAECLLAKDRRRAAEHLRQALPYLQSPQERLREVAVRFIGLAGRFVREKQREFQLMCRVLQNMANDTSPAISCLALQTLYIVMGVQSMPSSRLQQLRDQFRRLWKSRPSLFRGGRLSCWSALGS
ncbi:maestro heat-like repeat family member 5 [Catharus ustulatus]|uniref:maestro heat-like repeat family member 5 n=1 Tax=Catharus ustulatus TaxID=91951 RepID=UPI00140AC9C7|nr:maestro heat-like repeat family member 5 [Catharus ustulatus]XP_032921132.1 maestro heat-like repeat family member 5 [Catharus ustulatus]